MNNEIIKKEIRKILEKNNIGFKVWESIFREVREELILNGNSLMTEDEVVQYKKFQMEGNENLEAAFTSAITTDIFAHGMQTIGTVFEGIDFSQPFRIVVDYDPKQPRTIVKKYLTKEAHESYNVLIEEKLKVSQNLEKRQHKSNQY